MTKATKTARKATKTAKKMMTPSAKKRKKGFTLIELLIVVGILAVVAAVAIPNLTRFMGSGKEESFDADKSAIQAASDAFYYEQDEYATADGNPSGNLVFEGVTGVGADSGLVDLNYLVDVPKSAASEGGTYTWAIGANGEVTTVYDGSNYP